MTARRKPARRASAARVVRPAHNGQSTHGYTHANGAPMGQRDCSIKAVYSKRKDAAVAAARMRARTGSEVRAYHCDEHHGWHIGHPPGSWGRRQNGER